MARAVLARPGADLRSRRPVRLSVLSLSRKRLPLVRSRRAAVWRGAEQSGRRAGWLCGLGLGDTPGPSPLVGRSYRLRTTAAHDKRSMCPTSGLGSSVSAGRRAPPTAGVGRVRQCLPERRRPAGAAAWQSASGGPVRFVSIAETLASRLPASRTFGGAEQSGRWRGVVARSWFGDTPGPSPLEGRSYRLRTTAAHLKRSMCPTSGPGSGESSGRCARQAARDSGRHPAPGPGDGRPPSAGSWAHPSAGSAPHSSAGGSSGRAVRFVDIAETRAGTTGAWHTPYGGKPAYLLNSSTPGASSTTIS